MLPKYPAYKGTQYTQPLKRDTHNTYIQTGQDWSRISGWGDGDLGETHRENTGLGAPILSGAPELGFAKPFGLPKHPKGKDSRQVSPISLMTLVSEGGQ